MTDGAEPAWQVPAEATEHLPPAPGTPQTRWTGRWWAIALGALGLVLGAGMSIVGIVAFSDASTLSADADEAAATRTAIDADLAEVSDQIDAAQADAEAADTDLADLDTAVDGVVSATDALLDALDDAATAQNTMVDASSEAARLWNSGDTGGGQDAVRTQVAPATEEFRTTNDDVAAAIDGLQAAIGDLDEVLP